MKGAIKIQLGDITRLEVDAIVNAATIAVEIVRCFFEAAASVQQVIFCCFSENDCAVYRELIGSNLV